MQCNNKARDPLPIYSSASGRDVAGQMVHSELVVVSSQKVSNPTDLFDSVALQCLTIAKSFLGVCMKLTFHQKGSCVLWASRISSKSSSLVLTFVVYLLKAIRSVQSC